MATCWGVKEDAGLDGAAEATEGLDSAGFELTEEEALGLEATGLEEAVLEEDGFEETVLETWEETALELSGAEEPSLETVLSAPDSRSELSLVWLDSKEAVSDSMPIPLPPKRWSKVQLLFFSWSSYPFRHCVKQYYLLYFYFFSILL